MKATLEFDLPDDNEEYHMANKGSDMYSAMWDFSNYLRSIYKHGNDFKDAEDAVEKIRERFYEELSNEDISL